MCTRFVLNGRDMKAQISFEDALQIVRSRKITYAQDAAMQAMLSDIQGRVLIIEPGIGYRREQKSFSLMTNIMYSTFPANICKQCLYKLGL